ncbi:MAG: cation:proton antiporter [Pseudomonadota bacterium]
MTNLILLIIGAGLLFFSSFSKRLDETPLTAPMTFMLLGLGAHFAAPSLIEVEAEGHGFALFAELTLGLILFSDAARLKIANLRRDYPLPARMLLLALPLTILGGGAIASAIFPELTIWQAFLVAAILAPTDAALGAAVMASKAVPERLRETINVESGLNDGLALPAVLFTAALCAMGEGAEGPANGWVVFTLMQIGVGAAVGIGVGLAAGGLIVFTWKRRWLSSHYQNLSVIGLALLALAIPPFLGGNAFISAYAAGLTFGAVSSNAPRFVDFAETEGNFFSLLIFFFFGAALAPMALEAFNWRIAVYAALSLTAIRMVPIALSLIGAGLKARDVLFLGWFGPRGLASILFLVIAIEARDAFDAPMVEHIIFLTVFASVILHGASAKPFAMLFSTSKSGQSGAASSDKSSSASA